MTKRKFTQYIQQFDFTSLFNELGWDHFENRLPISVNDQIYQLEGIVEKKGFVILHCLPDNEGRIPMSALRRQIEQRVTKSYFEHLIIYTNRDHTEQIWQLSRKEEGKPKTLREFSYHIHQDPEALFQRLRGLLFTLDEEETITLVDVKARIAEHFAKNTEKVTKKFYTEFKKHHTAFIGFIEGINDTIPDRENKNKQWYASLMLNRLMFCYFIQKKGFLNQDPNYLQNKLKESKEQAGDDQFYNFYRGFLLQLFHEGLGKPQEKRTTPIDFGRIPYLNGGLFDIHELEQQFADIQIKDEAFERIFNFFDEWNWHLDIRIEATGKDINPDVIGYIFEKYINDRAAMGAYYTKDDITEYISKNCILPFLFDDVKRHYPKAFTPNGEVWQRLQQSGETYIYEAVKKGVDLDLPDYIAEGLDTGKPDLLERRKGWNAPTPAEYGLPTEIWRETVERRNRYSDNTHKIKQGEITDINEFITYNLNIRQFIQDVIENTEDADLIRHMYKAITRITVLDPTCGSGAFLFAALNILEPLYEACIQRMEQFSAEHPRKYKFFHEVLAQVSSEEHPNLQYFVYKSIILNNLYGVDIMREAVEIAKLRLFLKLVATVDPNPRKPNFGLEPLPDVDFNIRAGNTLVGFATEAELLHTIEQREGLFAQKRLEQFKEQCQVVSQSFTRFKDAQLLEDPGSESFKATKHELNQRLKRLNHELNTYLASNYGIAEENYTDKTKLEHDYQHWLDTHQPFHWLAEFYEIIVEKGGFDVIIGNPPYVEYSKVQNYSVQNYQTLPCKNLYALCVERGFEVLCSQGYQGLIIPISIACSAKLQPVRSVMLSKSRSHWLSHFSNRPGQLFAGAQNRLTILISSPVQNSDTIYTTRYHRWDAKGGERDHLLFNICYASIPTFQQTDISKIPKFAGSLPEKILLRQLQGTSLSLQLCNKSSHPLYWIRVPGYFCNFIVNPLMASPLKGGPERPRGEQLSIYFNEQSLQRASHAVLNSSMFYHFFCVFTDTRHINPSDVKTYPFSPAQLNAEILNELESLSQELTKIQKSSKSLVRKSGLLIESIDNIKTKNCLDEIDKVLAKHYGFTEEELDFIINYDIKYRMGKELNTP